MPDVLDREDENRNNSQGYENPDMENDEKRGLPAGHPESGHQSGKSSSQDRLPMSEPGRASGETPSRDCGKTGDSDDDDDTFGGPSRNSADQPINPERDWSDR